MRIVILRTNDLPLYTLLCLSETSDSATRERLQVKYGVIHLEVVFSADAAYEYRIFEHEDLKIRYVDSTDRLPYEISKVLKSCKSPIGEDVFRYDLVPLIVLAAESFHMNVICTPPLSALIDKVTIKARDEEDLHKLKQQKEREYFKTFESQCLQLNLIWESHWDRWVADFRGYIKSNRFPEKDKGFLGREQKEKDFQRLKSQYVNGLLNLTRKWRIESRSLSTTFHANCRKCNGTGEVTVRAGGPGNKRTYGGRNWNTIAQESGKSATIECGRKLLNGRKYFYRTITGFSGVCKSCGANLFQSTLGGSNYAVFPRADNWCVFPFHDVESWWEWCGIWMTIFDWEAHLNLPYEARDSGREFFKDFENVVDLHWRLQYPRPQLPETYMSP